MADYVRSRLGQTTHTSRGAVLTGARWLARQDASVLVAPLVIVLAIFGFIKIAEELGEGELAHVDEWILRARNSVTRGDRAGGRSALQASELRADLSGSRRDR